MSVKVQITYVRLEEGEKKNNVRAPVPKAEPFITAGF